jgi:hypothetical protein
MGDRKMKNILNLEIDELLSDGQLFILKALNSFSSRLFFFIVSVGEGFIDLFFRLLDFSGRNAELL